MLNFLESEILKGKYFKEGSRDRLRATLLNMFIIFGSFIMLLYAYENLQQGYYGALSVDVVMVLTMTLGYLTFPHYINIRHIAYLLIGASTFMISMSFILHGKHPELSLFWLATLPVFVFYFLGLKDGIRWNIYMFAVLATLAVLSYLYNIELIYDWEILSQILLGFIVITYMLYIIERERSSYEERMDRALEENKILLKEVHHRTKNNLQVVMGLLQSQAYKIDDPKYKKMFETHIDRLKAMSIMHKNLYTNKKFGYIEIKPYLSEIINSLKAYTMHEINFDIMPKTVNMKIAMNLGLIVNEAVSNSIEHAFDSNEGKIDVLLEDVGDRSLLIIKDNGKGFDTSKSYSSLGMTLIEDLSKSLPNSKLYINGEYGTVIRIYFDIEEV